MFDNRPAEIDSDFLKSWASAYFRIFNKTSSRKYMEMYAAVGPFILAISAEVSQVAYSWIPKNNNSDILGGACICVQHIANMIASRDMKWH